MAKSAPHSSFEFNCHLRSGRPAALGAGLWRSGWLGGQPHGRHSAMVCTHMRRTMTQAEGVKAARRAPGGFSLDARTSPPRLVPGGVTISDPSWPAFRPIVGVPQAAQWARRSEAEPPLEDCPESWLLFPPLGIRHDSIYIIYMHSKPVDRSSAPRLRPARHARASQLRRTSRVWSKRPLAWCPEAVGPRPGCRRARRCRSWGWVFDGRDAVVERLELVTPEDAARGKDRKS